MISKSAITVAILVLAIASTSSVDAFQSAPLPQSRDSLVVSYEYVPSGLTPAEYKKIKQDEAKQVKKNLGLLGLRGFKSRSMRSFIEARERGEVEHLLPAFNIRERLKKGELKKEDVPYMQRGGAWDNSDVNGAKKKKWLSSDKEYASGGFRNDQSVSIFGLGNGLDWTGSRAPAAFVPGAEPKFGKNYKAPNVKNLKKGLDGKENEKKHEKKFFGLF